MKRGFCLILFLKCDTGDLGDVSSQIICHIYNIHSSSVAQQMSVNFLSGSRGTKLFAYSKCRKDGKTSGVYIIDVTDDLGRDIAQITGIAFKK